MSDGPEERFGERMLKTVLEPKPSLIFLAMLTCVFVIKIKKKFPTAFRDNTKIRITKGAPFFILTFS